MNAARLCGAVLVALCATGPVLAQETCRDDEGVQECFNRILTGTGTDEVVEAAVTEAGQAQERAMQEEFALAQTGANTGGTATASTLNDLAQLFEALGLLSDSDVEGSKLALNLNFLLPVQDVENNNAQLEAIINTEPEPLEHLVQAFGETVREARRDTLRKDIPTFGDVQLSFTWSLVNQRFGRDYRLLRPLIAPLHQGAATRARNAARTDAIAELGKLLTRLNATLQPINAARAAKTPAEPPVSVVAPFEDLPISETEREQLKQATVNAALQRARIETGIQEELRRTGFVRLPELVEQQPQLLFTLSRDIRDDLVGPEKTSATLSWEMTRRNLSGFLHGRGNVCRAPEVGEGSSAQYDACVSALQSYLADANLDKQWRWKLAASYNRVKAVTYQFADDAVDLHLPDHDRWEVTLSAGRRMGENANAGRLDFELSYDSNLDNDTTNRERLRAALTFTRRVGEMDMPFSIVYANKDEFLADVDHQIGLHLGLKFRQPSGKPAT